MPILEHTESFRSRMRLAKDQGVDDFKHAAPGAKPLIIAAGAAGCVKGAIYGVPKATAVSVYEYVDQSFGKSRPRNFFDYLTEAPVFETLGFGILGAGVGAALSLLHLDIQTWGVAASFQAGLVAGLGSFASRHFPRVLWSSVLGGTGRGLSLGRQFTDWFKAPLGNDGAAAVKKPVEPQ